LSQLFILTQIGAVCLKESMSEAQGRNMAWNSGVIIFFNSPGLRRASLEIISGPPLNTRKLRNEKPNARGSEKFPHRFHDFSRVWKLAALFLRVQFLSIHRHFENSAAGRNELERSQPLFEFQNFFRQTDGLRLVVSSSAIFDSDLGSHAGERKRASRWSQAAGLALA